MTFLYSTINLTQLFAPMSTNYRLMYGIVLDLISWTNGEKSFSWSTVNNDVNTLWMEALGLTPPVEHALSPIFIELKNQILTALRFTEGKIALHIQDFRCVLLSIKRAMEIFAKEVGYELQTSET